MASISETTRKEHEALITLLECTIQNAVKLSQSIELKGDTSHEEDGFYLRYLQHQALSASSIEQLVLDGRYADSFKVTRTMLESFLMFQLMIRGFIYEKKLKVLIETKTHKEACQDIIARYERDKKAGKAPHILGVRPSKDFHHLFVTYEGLYLSEEEDNPIPFYYFAFSEYDSERHILGKIPQLRDAEFFPDITKKWQAHHQSLGELLSFGGMKKALLLNNIYDEESFVRISVHYHFLSTFVHPNKRSMRLQEGNVIRSYISDLTEVYAYDHYLSELCLLYTTFLLKYYLVELLDYLPKNFNITEEYLETVFAGFEQFDYFWFLKESPHDFDRISFETVKQMRLREDGTVLERLPYYKDPLARLTRMHSSFHEMTTGLVYRSPFERADARLR